MSERKRDELESVIDQYQDGLFRFAFFRTGSTDDSQDIVQRVFLKLYDRHGDLAAIENMKSYLYRATANACADRHRRRQSHRTVPLDYAVALAGEERADAVTAQGEYERVDAILRHLPDEQAEVVRMRTVDGFSFVEIADVLQIPPATAKSRFRYGIEKLRSYVLKS
jgi:RNA polymerase sigma-70 factor (ECF subfamily)